MRSTCASSSPLAAMLLSIPPGRRGALMQSVVSFRPNPTLEASFSVGPLRAAFAEYWEAQERGPVPIAALRAVLDPPVPIATVLEFSKLGIARDAIEIEGFLSELVRHLGARLQAIDTSS